MVPAVVPWERSMHGSTWTHVRAEEVAMPTMGQAASHERLHVLTGCCDGEEILSDLIDMRGTRCSAIPRCSIS